MEGQKALNTPHQDERSLLLAYLRDQLPPHDRDSFERRLLEDDIFSRRLEEAEFELLEEYADATLPPDEHDIVASWIAASPQHNAHIAITSLLRSRATAAEDHAPRSSNTLRRYLWPLATAASFVCVIAGSVFWHQQSAPRRNTQLAQVSVATPPARSGLPVHAQDTILLQAQRLRGGTGKVSEVPTFTVHRASPTRLQIIVPRAASGDPYTLELHRFGAPSGGQAIRAADLRAHTEASVPYVELILAPSGLSAGHYVGVLRSLNGSYDLGFSLIVHK